MNTTPDKTRLRAEVRAQRREMSRREVETASAAIHERVRKLSAWQEAETICAYLSLGNEVGTHDLVLGALGAKTILVPRSHEGGLMSWHRLHDWEALSPGMYGILEPPPQAAPVDPPRPDLILVPGLAFDRQGHRLGHGGGYYDRFLSRVGGIKLALAYEWQLYPSIPREGHDARMDAIVTEREIIRV